MEKKNHTKPNSNVGDQQDTRGGNISPMIWLIFAVLAFIVGGGLLAYVAHYYVNKDSARITFFAQAVFSLLAFIFVVLQTVIYFRQADALDDQITATERNTIYGQRAYVYAKIGCVSQDDLFDFVLLIENAGNSQANEVHVSYSFGFREREPEASDWQALTKERRIGFLAPRIHFPEDGYCRPAPTPDDLRSYYARKSNYYIWGKITYRDVFENDWRTSFSLAVSARGNLKLEIKPCLYGNEGT